jgi:phage gp36-like protein
MYTTLAELKKKVTQDELLRLTDDLETGAIDEAVVDSAIVSAGAEIDSYLGERYTLPLSPVPSFVSHLANDISIFNLYARSHEGPTDHWQKRYENAGRLLERIVSGEINLGIDDPSKDDDAARIVGPARLFSRDSMRGY